MRARSVIYVSLWVFVQLLLDQDKVLVPTTLDQIKELILLTDVIKGVPGQVKGGIGRDWGAVKLFPSSWWIVDILDNLIWVLEGLDYVLSHEIDTFEKILNFLPLALRFWRLWHSLMWLWSS